MRPANDIVYKRQTSLHDPDLVKPSVGKIMSRTSKPAISKVGSTISVSSDFTEAEESYRCKCKLSTCLIIHTLSYCGLCTFYSSL